MNTQIAVAPKLDVKAAIWAAIIAAAVFMMMEMIMVAVFKGASPWGPPRMIAAIGMGKGVLPPPATFDIGIMMVAMLIHFVVSIVLALIFGLIAKGRSVGSAVLIGAVFGLVLYFVNFYGMTSVFPWFAQARGWITMVSHIAYGAVLGWVYASFASKYSAVAVTR